MIEFERGRDIFISKINETKRKNNSCELPNIANAAIRALSEGDPSHCAKLGIRSAMRAMAKAQAQEYKLKLDLTRIIANDGYSGKKKFNLDNVAFLLEED